MESVKGLVEDKPGKSEQGVGIEHPSAKSRHLGWGHTQWVAELLYAKKVMMLDVRAVKPNYFSRPLRCRGLSLGLADLPPPHRLAWRRCHRTGPQSGALGALSSLGEVVTARVYLLPWGRPDGFLPAAFRSYITHPFASPGLRDSHLNPATTPPGAPVPSINTCSLTRLSFCTPIWGPCWALYANSMHFSCCSIQSCFSWKRKTQREKDDEREQWRTRALLKEHIPTPPPPPQQMSFSCCLQRALPA